jgi:hypothetical protein
MENVWAESIEESDVWEDKTSAGNLKPVSDIEEEHGDGTHQANMSNDEESVDIESDDFGVGNSKSPVIINDPVRFQTENPATVVSSEENVWGTDPPARNADASIHKALCDNDPSKLRETIEDVQDPPAVLAVKKVTETGGDEEEENDEEDDDDFGNFEEIQASTISFGKPILDIVSRIFIQDELDRTSRTAEKSQFLTEGGVKPMKCYNVLVADDRQYRRDKCSLLKAHERKFIEKTETFKKVSNIANDWLCYDKGIDKDVYKGMEIGKWGSHLGKVNNIFRWSSKYEKDEDHIETEEKKAEKTESNISQKLQNAAYREARKIVEKRLELEKREQLKIEKAKLEREQRLINEKKTREEELAKYKIDTAGDLNGDKKKKGFFDKMFQGKSKIAKDHLSHKKVASKEEAQGDHDSELSLREQAERDGYELTIPTAKGKKAKRSKKRNKNGPDNHYDADTDDEEVDGDDDDDAEDSDDMYVNGYNSLDPDADVQSLDNNLIEEDDMVGEEEPEDAIEETDVENAENEVESFGSFATVESARENVHSDLGNDNFGDSFDDFQTVEANAAVAQVQNTSKISHHEPINLIDL